MSGYSFFFFNDTATTEIYTLSLHDALPISYDGDEDIHRALDAGARGYLLKDMVAADVLNVIRTDRKSTRLNSSHGYISYAVFCLKKKTNNRSKNFMKKNTTIPLLPQPRRSN